MIESNCLLSTRSSSSSSIALMDSFVNSDPSQPIDGSHEGQSMPKSGSTTLVDKLVQLIEPRASDKVAHFGQSRRLHLEDRLNDGDDEHDEVMADELDRFSTERTTLLRPRRSSHGDRHSSTVNQSKTHNSHERRRALFAVGSLIDSSDLSRTDDSYEMKNEDQALLTHSDCHDTKTTDPAKKSVDDRQPENTNCLKPPVSCNSLSSIESTGPKVRLKYNPVLVELYDLDLQKNDGQWAETARWIKYEEDVEGVDHHWGQPHVAFLSFYALLSLRKLMRSGVFLFDSRANTYSQICEQVTSALIIEGVQCKRVEVLEILKKKQTHPLRRRMTRISFGGSFFEKRSECNLSARNTEELITDSRTDGSVQKLTTAINKHPTIIEMDDSETNASRDSPTIQSKEEPRPNALEVEVTSPVKPEHSQFLGIKRPTITDFALGMRRIHTSERGELSSMFFKKLPEGTESAQVFVGVIPSLTKTHFVMIRLDQAVTMPEILDGEIPIKFMTVILGPEHFDVCYHELGRSIATLMADKEFNVVTHEAKRREDLIRGVDGFLNKSVVIPPGEIDNKRLLSGDEIRKALKKQRNCRKTLKEQNASHSMEMLPKNGSKNREKSSEKRITFFSGAITDVTNRWRYYWSDYRDAANFQCLTSVVFMFFASFAPAITFGGLLGKYTNEKIGIIETLMAQCICGIFWGLFAAQPLMIMSATGPVLVFEVSLATFCSNLELDFLTIRLYSGIWVLLISLVTVGCEGSYMLKYVTRFTEDIFACLISLIFVAESLKFVYETFRMNPVLNFDVYMSMHRHCEDAYSNRNNGTQVENCGAEPNTALLSILITIATFTLAYGLRQLRQSYYLGRTLRRAIGDFGLLISIAVVASIAHVMLPGPHLARLEVPDHFDFTNAKARGHGLIVSAHLPMQKLWAIAIALIAALLVFILLFVETEITELLLCRKDRGLVKGTGFNWDLLLMGICTLICSIFGLPWMCAAAVQSLAHCSSLTVHKKAAPGGRPEVDHVVEQRVTTIGVSILIGLIAFGGSYLRLPLASLFGVFLYLGIMNLSGVQLIQRIILFFIPEKYFPITAYTESVNIWRMHLYTAIQIVCLLMVYAVKYFPDTALAFPFVLILFIIMRQFILSRIFYDKELKALDGDEGDETDQWMGDFYEDAPLAV